MIIKSDLSDMANRLEYKARGRFNDVTSVEALWPRAQSSCVIRAQRAVLT